MLSKNITEQHLAIVSQVQQTLGTWRKFTIGIDGVNGSGKSSLARFLSWQTEISVIETDMLLDFNKGGFNYRNDDLIRLFTARHSLNRPVIVEGIFLLKTLDDIGIVPDFRIYVEKVGHEGSFMWKTDFEEYKTRYRPIENLNYLYKWSEE